MYSFHFFALKILFPLKLLFTADYFQFKVLLIYSLALLLVHDQNASAGTSEFFRRLNINKRYCPVDEQRANEAVERCIQSVKRRLGTILSEKGENVEAVLTAILSSIRKLKHAITKKSPHFMNFGRAANTPLSILHDKVAV